MNTTILYKKDSNSTIFSPSVLGASWELPEPPQKDVLALMQSFQMPEIVARVLINRGIDVTKAADFIDPSLKTYLPDPFHLMDMDVAAERLAKAVLKKENIAIFGDYDVDGATSSALLAKFFRSIGINPNVYIPDRIGEGYGLNSDAIRKLKKAGADIVITVDCGTVSFEPIDVANEIGLEVIVVDHHISGEELPKALAIINPNRLDEASKHRQLAAVGVAFLLAVAVRRKLRELQFFFANPPEPDLMELLDLVALGTVCDVVPLTGVNRAFVARGLEIMKKRENIGLAALADIAGISTAPSVYHAGFILGPRINAGGRVGEADMGYKLLCTRNASDAHLMAYELDRLNGERQLIEEKILEEAMELAEKVPADSPIIFVASEKWHQGVIGIVASRLKDKYNKPSIVVALEKGLGKASARSISGVDLGAAVISAKMEGLLVAGGGHAMAAGFTVEQKKIEALRNFLNARVKKEVAANSGNRVLQLDGAVGVSAVTPDLAKSLEIAAPYGVGNREPRFVITNAKIIEADIVGEKHIRCVIGDGGPNPMGSARLKAVAFRSIDTKLGKELLSGYGRIMHIAGKIKHDSWQGRERAEIVIDDVIATG